MKTSLKSGLLIVALCTTQQACLMEDVSDEVLSSPEAAIASGYARGLIYNVDGEQYYLAGPMEDGARDDPGHYWRIKSDGTLEGRHYNTGPFGISKWWSSDAADGQLLYNVEGKIDTWTPEKAAAYAENGFVHYHHLVRVSDRMMHHSKVLWTKHIGQASFTLDGGDKPWLAHSVTPGVDKQFKPNAKFPYPAREKFIYVLGADVGADDHDFVAVVGTDPDDPATYSKITHRVDMPMLGDEVHHFGYNIFQNKLLVPGLFSGRLHVLDLGDDPARPVLESWNSDLTADSGYIVPHTVIGTPDGGYLLTMIGSNTATTAPGGLVKVDADARFVAPFGPSSNRDGDVTPPKYMYDAGINLLRNRMVTTTFGLPADVAPTITTTGLGNEVYVWDFKNQEVLQTVDLGAETGALEVRWVHDPGVPIGFTNTPGTSQIWRWHDTDLDGTYTFDVAIDLPPGSIPTDMLLSHDDKYMYIANWMGNNVMQYDISDPFNPIFVSQVTVPHAQMLRLSEDGTRLYVTNSLLSTWDDTEFPAGVIRNTNYGVFLIDINMHHGGMTLNNSFFVDFDSVQMKNSVGAARPHQVFLDPNTRMGFGDH
jgi:methanethiol oxidase